MMQHAHALVHGCPPAVQPGISPVSAHPGAVPAPAPHARQCAQEVATTASRRLRRHDFLRAVDWAISCGQWPRANHTTLRIAHDLARRMNAEGHVAYGRLSLAKRLNVSRRTVDRHVALLRQIGLLAWVVHGSRKNTRPGHLPGWSGTATIYAATAPAAWDTAMGHRIRGTGYGARLVGFTPAGRQRAINDARDRTRSRRGRPSLPAGRSPRHTAVRVTPSCGQNPPLPTAKVVRGKGNTPRERQSSAATSAAVAVAAWVRPRVPWTQTEGLRRLAFALRPLIAAGLSREEIAAELTSWWLSWRPRSPAAYLLARWRTGLPEHAPGPQTAAAESPGRGPNTAFLDAVAGLRAELPGARETAAGDVPPPAFAIRDRIQASLRAAAAARLHRAPDTCASLADWDALCDERGRRLWTGHAM
ncbi:HTH domain-containing protein [Streptomyces sp. NPDC087300]|uniref:HTH domain-containing protein n=1 Tax=Streptomyces sp. NPDC087300 TaxID=3365780 RepID=UPI0037F5ED25